MCLCTFICPTLSAREKKKAFSVGYRLNITRIESDFKNNDKRVEDILSYLEEVSQDSTISIIGVDFCGAASPEGSYEWNRYLAKERLRSLEKIIRSAVDIPDSLIVRDDSYIPWYYLEEQMENSQHPYKDDVIAIINEEPFLVKHIKGQRIDRRVNKLRELNGGTVWKEIYRLYFADMRNAYAIITTAREDIEPLEQLNKIASTAILENKTDRKIERHQQPEIIKELPELWTPKLYLKTNAIGLGLAIGNGGIEADIAKHWSLNAHVYHSGWNYFKETLKFRTNAIQPEIRYWFSKENDGFFTGAHFTLAYYNFAFDGDIRYQDYLMETPAMGGGINFGYRLPISHNNRWKLEFSLGAGVYPLHYDKFHNVHNGMLIESVKRTYWGIDQAAISLSYMFDLRKKSTRK